MTVATVSSSKFTADIAASRLLQSNAEAFKRVASRSLPDGKTSRWSIDSHFGEGALETKFYKFAFDRGPDTDEEAKNFVEALISGGNVRFEDLSEQFYTDLVDSCRTSQALGEDVRDFAKDAKDCFNCCSAVNCALDDALYSGISENALDDLKSAFNHLEDAIRKAESLSEE